MLRKLLFEVSIASRLLRGRDRRRWLGALALRAPAIWRQRSLGPADECLGESFTVFWNDLSLAFSGASFGVIREIFGRQCYITPMELQEARCVVDFGGNCGAFTVFALLCAPRAHVHVVETQPELAAHLRGNLEANGLASRATVHEALIGEPHDKWTHDFRRRHPEIPSLDLEAFFSVVGPCDFLKCDIEGAEFQIVTPRAQWLRQCRRFSLEYHGAIATGEALSQTLRGLGFAVTRRDHGVLGYLDGQRESGPRP